MPPRLVLVGPPGAGKSTVGRLVAQRLGVPFVDTDDEVAAVAGKPVADIFVDDGEPAFRALEEKAVEAALVDDGSVVALGGGAVMNPSTRDLLRDRRVVFLDVGIKDAARRVGLNRDRPLLLGNPRAQWLRLMESRRAVYDEVSAGTAVATDGRTPDEVADEVVSLVAGEPA